MFFRKKEKEHVPSVIDDEINKGAKLFAIVHLLVEKNIITWKEFEDEQMRIVAGVDQLRAEDQKGEYNDKD